MSSGGHQGYIAVNGVEVINQARTLAYLRSGLSGTEWQVSDGSCCAALTSDAFPLSVCTPGAGMDEFATDPLASGRLAGALNGAIPATWAYDTTGEGDVRDVGHANGKPGLYFPAGMSSDGTITAQIDVLQPDPAAVAATDQFAVWRVDSPGSGTPLAVGAVMNVSGGAWRIQALLSAPSGQAANTAVSIGAGVLLPGRIWIVLTLAGDGIYFALYGQHPSTGAAPIVQNTSSIATLCAALATPIPAFSFTSASRPGFGAFGTVNSTNAPGRYDAVSWTPACTNTGHLYPSNGLTPGDTIYPDFYGDFRNPGTDNASWFSAQQPESADFLGCLLQSPITGVDPTVTRDVQSRLAGVQGAAIGPEVVAQRVITFDVVVVARSCPGMEYGRRWLADALAGNLCDTCALNYVDVRLSCPPGADLSVGKWRLYEVALTGLDEQPSAALDEKCLYSVFKVEMTAGDGWLYKAPVTVAPTQALNPTGTDTLTVPFDQWLCTQPASVCATITRPNIGVTAPIITVAAGPNGLSTLVAWPAFSTFPDGIYPSDCLYPADGSLTPATNTCPVQFNLPSLDAGAQLVIDNSRKKITLVGVDGTPLDGTPFLGLTAGQAVTWIDTEACEGTDLTVCAALVAACGSDDQASVTIQSQHRER